jgi:Uma2 family endonuclease
MASVLSAPEIVMPPVDHLQLPCDDGAMVHNFQELPLAILLTDTILPVAQRLYGDRFAIGQDCAIYYRQTEPPLDGAKAPDWFLVPNVPGMLAGQYRRSYVMWREVVAPLVLLEFVSGDGSEERDTTPETGKFWVYERAIRPAYYGIFEAQQDRLEMHRHVEDRFVRMEPNLHGRYPIAQLGLELGIWHGMFIGGNLPWLRWWDADGNLLLTGHERAEQELQRALQEKQYAERLAARLRELGVDPKSV